MYDSSSFEKMLVQEILRQLSNVSACPSCPFGMIVTSSKDQAVGHGAPALTELIILVNTGANSAACTLTKRESGSIDTEDFGFFRLHSHVFQRHPLLRTWE